MSDQERTTNLADERKHMACYVALSESGTSISKQILPLSFESIIVGTILEGGVVL